MAEDPIVDGLFAIQVDTDDDDGDNTAAVEGAAGSRTFQSEADFRAQKAMYSAKIDTGDNYAELLKVVPHLCDAGYKDAGKVKLSKKEFQLLGYAVGEMYYDRRYGEIVGLCARVEERCEVDGRVRGCLGRWVGRCRVRMEGQTEGAR